MRQSSKSLARWPVSGGNPWFVLPFEESIVVTGMDEAGGAASSHEMSFEFVPRSSDILGLPKDGKIEQRGVQGDPGERDIELNVRNERSWACQRWARHP